MVDPLAVVLPAVLLPRRCTQLFSAAAPGAATDAVMMEPAEVPNVTLLALLKARVVNENDPFDADATGVTPPPAPTLMASPLLFSVIEAFVALVPVPAYPAALSENPEEFTVQVTLVCAVLSPMASFEALAVVKALWLAVIAAPAEVPKLIPFRLEKESV